MNLVHVSVSDHETRRCRLRRFLAKSTREVRVELRGNLSSESDGVNEQGEAIRIFGTHDEATVEQLKRCVRDQAVAGVLCADGHKGYSQPVGGVVAYRDHIAVSGVGYDIGCGNLAYKTDARGDEIQPRIESIMDDIAKQISFGVGRTNPTPVDHELFDDEAWEEREVSGLKRMARDQLGTVGSGNHYVDVFVDEEDRVWVGVHFGSRGLGHRTATRFLKLAGGRDGMDVPPTLLEVESDLGRRYIRAMTLAGRYAYAGREYVAGHVVREILGASIVDEVHNHHNYAWREEHNSQPLWVVRKGATPAFPGQKGFVGGSMGDDAVIVQGVDSKLARESLYSTVHGAGRVMSRTAAKGKTVREPSGKRVRQSGRISRHEMHRWLKERNVCLRGGDLDEAPQAYRRLNDVLDQHRDTIKILHVLRPLGVAMAGPEIHDPYKD